MVVVIVVVGTLTGPVGSLSAAGFAVMAATVRMGADLDEIIGDHEPHFGE
jgi:hypothetical protein